jgi:hypothetical protein
VAAALGQDPGPYVARLLDRLAEVAGDPGDVAQTYVTNLMLCVHALAACLPTAAFQASGQAATAPMMPGHCRSVSYNYNTGNMVIQLRGGGRREKGTFVEKKGCCRNCKK